MQLNNDIQTAGFLANEFASKFGMANLVSFFKAQEKDKRLYPEYKNDPVGFGEDILKEWYTDDIKKLMLSVRDHRITVAKSATGTGKSHSAASLAIWFKKCHPRSQVFTVAHPFENQKILWGELSTKAEKCGLFEKDKILDMHIQCVESDKDFIRALSVPTTGTDEVKEGKFSGKHYDHMLFIIDEGDTVPDFAYKGIEGCMSGGIIVRLLVLFNPRNRAGKPYRMERDREAHFISLTAFNHINVITGENHIPGAVDRETTVARINKWSEPRNTEEKVGEDALFTVPDFLVGTTAEMPTPGKFYPPLPPGERKITHPSLSYMTLARYPAQGVNQLISTEWIDAARARWDAYVSMFGEKGPDGVQPVMGLDCAGQGMDSNVAYFRYGGFLARAKRWQGVDMMVTGDKASRYFHNFSAKEAFIDANGVGYGVAPHMRRLGCNAHGLMVQSSPTVQSEIGFFRILRDQLLWLVREWLRTDPGAMLPPEELLLEELMIPTYEIINGKICVMSTEEIKENIERSPDDLMSLAQTFGKASPEESMAAGPALEVQVADSSAWT